MSSRILALTMATATVIASFVGCGAREPQFDPSTKYSPASLAQEFAFRYKSLARSNPDAEKPEAATTKVGAITKGGATTKAAPANTLDALLGDVIAKAGMIPGLSHSEACQKVAEEVARDPSFTDADKKIIADKLGHVTN